MHIGKPISVKGYDKANVTQLMENVRDVMLSHLKEPRTVNPEPE